MTEHRRDDRKHHEALQSEPLRKHRPEQRGGREGDRREHPDQAQPGIVERNVVVDQPNDWRDRRDGRSQVEGEQNDADEGERPPRP
jgi:hypothetical protein